MSRRTRSQRQRPPRQRTGGARVQRAMTTPPRRQQGPADRMALYRELASPGLNMRLVLIAGLLLLAISQGLQTRSDPPLAVQVCGVAGGACVLLFVAAAMLRHYRAIYRIRRDSPEAWQPTMSFALASLAVPLGFSGPTATPRDRLLRRLTVLLVLAYAVTAVVAINRQH